MPKQIEPTPGKKQLPVVTDILKFDSKENAVNLLAKNGYADAVIPDPIEDNIQKDRIYFLVKVGKKLRPRTAFIIAALDPNSIELEIYRGWQIEHPKATA